MKRNETENPDAGHNQLCAPMDALSVETFGEVVIPTRFKMWHSSGTFAQTVLFYHYEKYTIDSVKRELISLFSQMICSANRYVGPTDTVGQTVLFYHYEKYTMGSAKREFTSLFGQTARSANRYVRPTGTFGQTVRSANRHTIKKEYKNRQMEKEMRIEIRV
uniref:Uncharacterized protein n=1 Tax=Romanomermis culicivorax TaxID=13658 RepID=A0A915KVP3_ROMCU